MTNDEIIYLMRDHLMVHTVLLNDHIKSEFYDRALTDLGICKELTILLKYIKEHEVNK